jgi:hypothetical protein
MIERRALAAAPCAILPVALVFIMARALLGGDWRELFAAPFSALMITFVGYPIALAVGWLLLRIAPALVGASVARALTTGVACAEISFWILIAPFWEREFSDLFCAALVAGCGAATAMLYQWRLRKTAGA